MVTIKKTSRMCDFALHRVIDALINLKVFKTIAYTNIDSLISINNETLLLHGNKCTVNNKNRKRSVGAGPAKDWVSSGLSSQFNLSISNQLR